LTGRHRGLTIAVVVGCRPAVVLCTLAFVGCAFETTPTPPLVRRDPTNQGTGQNDPQPGSDDAAALRDATSGFGGTGGGGRGAGAMDGGLRDAAMDAGGTGTLDTGLPECSADDTRPCGVHVGACALGTQRCTDGSWSACEGDIAPEPESCATAADDDCDGVADEGCPCANGATRPCGIATGACVEGSQECSGGTWGSCEGDTSPADETCDGDDEDCDGTTDEGANACGGACALSHAPGTPCDGTDGDQCTDDLYVCNGENAVACSTGATDIDVCNGLDDDCAGGCDDPFACCLGNARSCTTSCGSSGSQTCTAGCAWSGCVPPSETCDGDDDDCDTSIDEGFGLCTSCCDSSADADGCNDDRLTCSGCQDVGGPIAEVCNDSDDDCDAAVDEGLSAPLLPAGLVLMFDGPACPSGWTAVSAQADRFIMGHDGNMNFTETGGSHHVHTLSHAHATSSDPYPSHQHTVTAIDASQGSANAVTAQCAVAPCASLITVHSHGLPSPVTSGAASGGSHSHALPTAVGSTGPAQPPAYREVLLCRLVSTSTRAVPASAIAMFESACGAGWAEDTSFRNRFIRGDDGDAAFAETAGSDTHTHDPTHDHGGTTNQAGGSHAHPSGGNTEIATVSVARQLAMGTSFAPGHSHAVAPRGPTLHEHGIAAATPTVSSSSSLPPFYEMAFCSAAAAACPPPGMTALFAGSCPSGWSEIMGTRNRLIRGHDGDGVFGETGGTSAPHQHTIGGHSHAIGDAGHTHEFATSVLTAPTSLPQIAAGGGAFGPFALFDHDHGGTMTSEGIHSHTVTAGAAFNSGTATVMPPWREYVVCSKN
jgi:hypothetical protein